MGNAFYVGLLAIPLITANTGMNHDWIAYKDELQIKVFKNLQTYENAKEFCSGQGDEDFKASLAIVKDIDFQKFLGNSTKNFVDSVWLGGKYDNQSRQVLWEDGDPLTYKNWQKGFPNNVTDRDGCIEMHQSGKWAHVACQKKNFALCQKTVSWSLEEAVAEIIRLRNDPKIEILEARKELKEVQTKQNVGSAFPIGFTYVEYFNQPSAPALWPTLQWQDITYNYDGLFFRAAGSGSGGWGAIQAACAPRITEMEFFERDNTAWVHQATIPSNGWSRVCRTGAVRDGRGNIHFEGNRFKTEGCEVRPKNQAIRIWKRVG